jgi:decaprenylphospho-beta-D-erythro-pentofuranosid-2-ulose 2-reductase
MRDALGSVESVLVVGGTSDIGLATAAAFVRDGARRIVLAARDAGAAQARADEIGTGADVSVVEFDVVSGDHDEFARAVFRDHGDVDVVVLAAGDLGHLDRQAETSAARPVLEVNFTGTALTALAVTAQFTQQGHGTLVVLSSAGAVRVRASNFAYGSSKAGIDAFAQGLGDRCHGTGVEVMVVRPGFVHTSMTAGLNAPPLASSAGEVAEAIVDGVRRRAAVVWVPGTMRWMMLAFLLLPRALFRRLPI